MEVFNVWLQNKDRGRGKPSIRTSSPHGMDFGLAWGRVGKGRGVSASEESLERTAIAFTKRIKHKERSRNMYGFRKRRDLMQMCPRGPRLKQKE